MSSERITYHLNEPNNGHQDLMSSETFKDLAGKVCHRTVARFYSKKVAILVVSMLKSIGVYE